MSIARRIQAMTAACTIIGMAGQSVAATGVSSDVGACIRTRAAGRGWLEKTLWGLYDQEGGYAGAEIRNRNDTFDLGPLQVNSSWVPIVAAKMGRDEQEVRRWLRDDPCFNVGVAAWLFLSGYNQALDYWGAVGAYHSPTPWRARAYAHGVAARLRLRYGPDVFARR